MTDSLELIEKEFEQFRSLVEHCRSEAKPDMANIRDAYERFYRLCERYDHEDAAGALSKIEEAALRKVFRENKFIESVGRVRGISTHVETGDVELLDPDKVRFTLTAKSSAAAMFAAPNPDARFDLGTSGHITYGEARNPPDITWFSSFGKVLAVGLAIALAISLAVYGLTYAIGPTGRFLYWVLVLGVGFLLAVFGHGFGIGWLGGLVLATIVGFFSNFLLRWLRQPSDDDATVSAHRQANNEHERTGPDPTPR